MTVGDGLLRGAANYMPLTPLSLLSRTADVYPGRIAVRYGERTLNYKEFAARCRRLGAALSRAGIGHGDVVSVLAPNTPAMLEAHFGVAMAGGVLHAINIRLDAPAVAFQLDHASTRLLIADDELMPLALAATALQARAIPIVRVADPAVAASWTDAVEYEEFIAPASAEDRVIMPRDEWDAIALNYTSGTTGDPKGVVYHHRGAYLNALGNVLAWRIPDAPIYLWTLPMFHCNGWCFPWTVTALGGTHVCLRRVDAGAIVEAMRAERVTHFCGAPIVLAMLAEAPEDVRRAIPPGVAAMTAGAPPPAAVLDRVEALGLSITHTYGLTETFGPCVLSEEQPRWADEAPAERARLKARQGVRYQVQEALEVVDPKTMIPVPSDGKTIGEVMMRGNVVMKGYASNPAATTAAFAGGWFHSGDLGVRHSDGYVELKDRAKDIVISGGENISSIEIENALFRHPAVLEAAVVARPDPKWGEVPCAFVTLRSGMEADAATIQAFLRTQLAGFKVPKTVVFGPIPKTATGKVQKYLLREMARSVR